MNIVTILLYWLVVVLQLVNCIENHCLNNESTHLFDVKGFMNGLGYSLEEHTVVTKDGYILTIHRVPHGRNESSSNNSKKPVVLVIHGITFSSVNFMFLGPNRSIVPMLADAGYDVWAGNNRGNTWSRRHVSLSPEDPEFWNFSYHEMGVYDLPAMIDYILNATAKEKLFYIGHSQGTTQYFVLTATEPEYNDKIILMSALGPIAPLRHIRHPILGPMADQFHLIDEVTNLLNIHQFLPYSEVVTSFCQKEANIDVCELVLFDLFGLDWAQIERETVPLLYQSYPEGTSIKSLKHIIQGSNTGIFGQYDYGVLKNFLKYGQRTPPAYNLSKVTAPVALYYDILDVFVTPEDVDHLEGELHTVAGKYVIDYEFFSHGDFVYGKDVGTLVNAPVIELMNEFINN